MRRESASHGPFAAFENESAFSAAHVTGRHAIGWLVGCFFCWRTRTTCKREGTFHSDVQHALARAAASDHSFFGKQKLLEASSVPEDLLVFKKKKTKEKQAFCCEGSELAAESHVTLSPL